MFGLFGRKRRVGNEWGRSDRSNPLEQERLTAIEESKYFLYDRVLKATIQSLKDAYIRNEKRAMISCLFTILDTQIGNLDYDIMHTVALNAVYDGAKSLGIKIINVKVETVSSSNVLIFVDFKSGN